MQTLSISYFEYEHKNKCKMIIVDSVSLQTQGPSIPFVLERELIPHYHVPESVSTDNWLLQPRRIQPAVWYAWPVSQYHTKRKCFCKCKKTHTDFGVLQSSILCFRSAIHSVQPIELNFTDSPTDGSAGNTIQISMDCITMHEPDETLSVST